MLVFEYYYAVSFKLDEDQGSIARVGFEPRHLIDSSFIT
jgi:hypothetical protein